MFEVFVNQCCLSLFGQMEEISNGLSENTDIAGHVA